MSQSINLVAYQANENGKLYESKTDLIETVFITPSLLSELQKASPLIKKNIFETVGSEDHYSIECFNDSEIEGAIKKLEEVFLSILASDGKKLLGQESKKDSNKLALLSSEHIASGDLDDSINRFRTLTNVINVFKLKHNQYSSDASVVLKLG
ncbi:MULTISPECIES: hypothetical protein [Pseudoalteromonas]|jgi:hypothetical protein|uniref:Uncharacterized protein n=1 Tax=Pseudoalteromonas neustonica TaxID=1840331 RepID=A0ABY3F9N4_9GAMM|nr:hypothetical protein [Pseudoalteromonas neustonica]TVU80994.1 hypothetical protein FQP85_18180 [Pseudoalteromonas neustonica]